MISCQRHLFDIPRDVAYLNCAYMSPLANSVRMAGEQAVARKARPWTISAADFFGESEKARALFARIVGATADDIAIIPSASYGIALAAANLPLDRGRQVVVLADEFPSNVYAWRERAGIAGAEIVTVARPADGDWTAAVLAAIGPRTAVAALSHSHWTDGGLVDLAQVRGRLDAVGGTLAVDVTQSLGALPFDVAEIRPDFLVCAAYKWLMGPYSLGFVYVAPRHQQGTPIEHNWIARRDSENFAGLVSYRDEFQPGARRYDMGERSNFALMPMAVAALEMLLGWGVANIHATLSAMNAGIAARAADLGLTAAPANLRAGHFLGLRFPRGVPAGLPERLAAEQVHVSVRGGAMRVTPHLYNDQADIDRLFAVLRAAI